MGRCPGPPKLACMELVDEATPLVEERLVWWEEEMNPRLDLKLEDNGGMGWYPWTPGLLLVLARPFLPVKGATCMNPPVPGELDFALQIPPPKLGEVPRLPVDKFVRRVMADSP
jgi:hypothetical protein